MIERIAIFGTGLLGTSAALALRAAGFAGEIVGWNRGEEGAQTALEMGAIGAVATDALKAAKESQLVLLAVPILIREVASGTQFGNVGKQTIENTGPLPKERMETGDEEFLASALDFIDRKTKEGGPWFCYFNPTRMHVFTHLKPSSVGKTGLGLYPDGMVETDGGEKSRDHARGIIAFPNGLWTVTERPITD